MCGIVGYVGKKNPAQILLEGLKRLEYRGYDSAGMAIVSKSGLKVAKAVGKVAALEKKVGESKLDKIDSILGIAHTRWATHGAPSERNAHPHCDESGRFAVVHNGIIDNYLELRQHLEAKGRKFASETDSEVIAHLVSECYEGDLAQAVAATLRKVTGTYAVAVVSLDNPGMMVVARYGSPLIIGVGEGENFAASDAAAIAAYTRKVIYLDDRDLAIIKPDNIDLRNLSNIPVSREINHLDWQPEAAERGTYDHYMHKEIHEQPQSITNSIRGRINTETASSVFAEFRLTPAEMLRVNRVIIAACGTSMHAGMVGRLFFEQLADLPVIVEQAAEFRYRNPIIEPDTLVIAISQSGETADTLAAVREAKIKGATVSAICNVVGSTIAREAERCIYLHAGPEIGVASTKAFTCQVSVLLMLAVLFGRSRRLSRSEGLSVLNEVEKIPSLVNEIISRESMIEKAAEKFAKYEHAFYIGRGVLYPVALEGALKLKEISYIHAEGYHAAELKHGPIALLGTDVPVVALAPQVAGYDKLLGNIQECRARKSPVLAIATDGDNEVMKMADSVIYLPPCSEYVIPVVTAVVLQLLAYHVARVRGCEIDQPKNLAKSVTVE